MDSSPTFHIELRTDASEQVSKPPCKGRCKDCKNAAKSAADKLQTQTPTVTFANHRD